VDPINGRTINTMGSLNRLNTSKASYNGRMERIN
jgi:hypothetical protein